MIKVKAYDCKLPVELRDESDRKCTQCKQLLTHELFEYKSDGVNMYKMCNFCRGRRTKQWKDFVKQQEALEINDTPTYSEEESDDDEHDGFTYGKDFYKDAMEILT